MWAAAISALSAQLPEAFLTEQRVAIQGIYKRQNIIKENADKGVNISVSILKNEEYDDEVTTNVLIIASLAASPAIKAEAARQSPKPIGSRTGETVLPRNASMLSLLSETGCMSIPYDCRYQTRTDAVKITVNAFRMKLMTLTAASDKTPRTSGM